MFGDQDANQNEFFQKLFCHPDSNSTTNAVNSHSQHVNLSGTNETDSTPTDQMLSSKISADRAEISSSSSNINLGSILASSTPLLMDQLVSQESLMSWSDSYSSVPMYQSLAEGLSNLSNGSVGGTSEANIGAIVDYGVSKLKVPNRGIVGRMNQLQEDNVSFSSDDTNRNRSCVDSNMTQSFIDMTKLSGRDSSSLSSSTSGSGRNESGGGFGRSYSSVLHQHDLIQMDHANLIPKMIPVHDSRQHSFTLKPSSFTSNTQPLLNSAHQLLPNFENISYHQQSRHSGNDPAPAQPSSMHMPYHNQSGYYNQNLSLNPAPSSNQDRIESSAVNSAGHNPVSSYFQGRNSSFTGRGMVAGGSSNPNFNQIQVGKRRAKLPFFISNSSSEGQNQLKSDIYGDSSNNPESTGHYSRKVFVGGLPPDIDEEEIKASFRRFGPLVVDWPHKAESKSYFPPKGYAFLLFHEETSVQALIDACLQEEDKLYLCVSSPTIKDKPVQIRPWRLSDADFVLDSTLTLDPRKTVFVGGVPRPLKASELATIMNNLYGGVCYAGIDTDPELKYPKGAGRVAFSNHQSYLAAISARFVHLHHSEIEKRVEVKPYVLDDQFCDECQGSRCGNKFAPFFCANITCLRYYCENCWSTVHSQLGREFHKPLVKEGADRPRGVLYRWS